MILRRGVLLGLSAGCVLLNAGLAQAATYIVTSNFDDALGTEPGTLSWAITNANADAGSTIQIDGSVATISVSGTLPSITQNTTIVTSGSVEISGGVLTGSGTITLAAGSSVSGHNAPPSIDFTGWNFSAPNPGSTLSAGISMINDGTLRGGDGGHGGNNVTNDFYYALGPQGGVAGSGATALVGSGVTITNTGTILGGNGGTGGHGARGASLAGHGNSGGDGGDGISGSGFQLVNSGTIRGGEGGEGGLSALGFSVPAHDGAAGANGIGVVSTGGSTIHTSGLIAGANGANAISLSGGGNSLIVETGATFVGDVVSTSASGDTFYLTGNAGALENSTFDVSTLRGFDTLTKTGTGNWSLTGTTDTARDWTISGGTLIADTDSLSGNIVNNAALDFAQATDGTHNGNISGTGSLTKSGAGKLTLSGINTYSGGTVVSDGTLIGNSQSLSGNIVNNTNLVFDQRQDGVFAGAIFGSGTIEKRGNGLLTLNQSQAFTGDLDIFVGKLSAQGALASTVQVHNGATLGVTGAGLGGIGTLTIGGNLNLASGSQLTIKIGANGNQAGIHNDIVNVTGVADISNAILFVDKADLPSSARTSQTYTILSAATPVHGTFAAIEDSFAFLDASIDYTSDPSDVLLTMARNSAAFGSFGASPNQKNVGNALTHFAPNDPIMQELLWLSEDEVEAAYSLMTGEIHASGQQVVDKTFALFQSNLGRRGAGFVNVGSSQSLAYGPEPGTAVASLLAIEDVTEASHRGSESVWLKPLAGWGRQEQSTAAAQLDWWAAGLAGGYEVENSIAGGTGIVGLGLGYMLNGSYAPALLSTNTGQGGQAAIYGSWSDGAASLAGSLNYGLTHMSSSRDIAVGGLTSTAQAEYWAHNVGVYMEASYGFALGEHFTVRPIGSLNAGWAGHNGFSETGAGAFNATVAPDGRATLETGLGVGLDYAMMLNDGAELALNLRAVWTHEFSDASSQQSVSLAGGGGAFSVSGAAIPRDQLVLGAGVAWTPLSGPSLSADYAGTFSSNQAAHILSAKAKLAF